MEYLDFDLEVEEESERSYRVVAHSLEGDARQSMLFPFDKLELENSLLKLQNALLKSSGQYRAATDEEKEVQKFGQILFESLLSGNVRSLYETSRTRAVQEGRPGVRLRLRILASDLVTVPWEYLYDKQRGEYLSLSRRTPLVRYLEVAQPIVPLRITPPLRILAMVAGPSDQPPLNVEHEQEHLHLALSGLEARGLVKVEWLPGQTWRDLQRAMRGGPWHIFHFIGHGGFHSQVQEGMLALTNEDGSTHLLSATQLASLLVNHDALRLVILNACEGATSSPYDLFSSTAATLVRRGVPAVLAMQYAISDRAAIECSRTFYEALADGLPVDSALIEARLAINVGVNNSLEWGTPVLYMRTPSGALFDLPALGLESVLIDRSLQTQQGLSKTDEHDKEQQKSEQAVEKKPAHSEPDLPPIPEGGRSEYGFYYTRVVTREIDKKREDRFIEKEFALSDSPTNKHLVRAHFKKHYPWSWSPPNLWLTVQVDGNVIMQQALKLKEGQVNEEVTTSLPDYSESIIQNGLTYRVEYKIKGNYTLKGKRTIFGTLGVGRYGYTPDSWRYEVSQFEVSVDGYTLLDPSSLWD